MTATEHFVVGGGDAELATEFDCHAIDRVNFGAAPRMMVEQHRRARVGHLAAERGDVLNRVVESKFNTLRLSKCVYLERTSLRDCPNYPGQPSILQEYDRIRCKDR